MRLYNLEDLKCHLMSQSRTIRLVAKVDAEVVVHLHPAIFCVNVDDEHHRALEM